MRPCRMLLLPAALLASLTVARPAQAESFSLEWSAPEGCPAEQEVLVSLRELLGADPRSIAREPLEVRITVKQIAPNHWALDLQTTSGDQQRTRHLEAPTCHELARAASVVMALAVDPERKHLRLGPRPREEEAEAPPPPPPPEPPRPAPRRPESERARRAWGLGRLDLVGTIGQMPDPALGAGLSGGIVVDSLRLRLGAQAVLPQRTEVSEGKGGQIGMATGLLEACFVLAQSPVRLGPCVGVEAGALWAHAFGVTQEGSGAGPWVAIAVGEELALPLLGQLSVVVGSALVIPVASPRFLLDEVGEVHQPAAVGGRLTVGVEVKM
jgi:hypothetical protein